MVTRRTRHGLAIACLAATSALLLASCSSEPEATPSASASASATTTDPTAEASASATAAPTGAAAAACAAYFELDLLNSQYAGGAVADGDFTEEQIRTQFKAQLKELVAQAELAVEDGTADLKLLANAQRMKKTVNKLDKDEPLSNLTKAQAQRFAKSSLRVQKACTRAGYPLPADNATARTAAGLT